MGKMRSFQIFVPGSNPFYDIIPSCKANANNFDIKKPKLISSK